MHIKYLMFILRLFLWFTQKMKIWWMHLYSNTEVASVLSIYRLKIYQIMTPMWNEASSYQFFWLATYSNWHLSQHSSRIKLTEIKSSPRWPAGTTAAALEDNLVRIHHRECQHDLFLFPFFCWSVNIFQESSKLTHLKVFHKFCSVYSLLMAEKK